MQFVRDHNEPGHSNLISKLIHCGVAGLFAAAMIPAEAGADLEWKSQDGRVSAKLEGGIQVDGNLLREDDNASFGSPLSPGHSGAYLRRAYIRVGGKVYGWRYSLEPKLEAEAVTGDLEFGYGDLYIAHAAPGGEIQFGQRRPFRGMEALTRYEDIALMERPFASAAGGVAGLPSREFALGAFYLGHHDLVGWGLGGYSLRNTNDSGADGFGGSGRLSFTPLLADGETIHLGLSLSYEAPEEPTETMGTTVAYAGYRGPVAIVGLSSGGEPVTTLGLEYANVFGPFYAQAELMAQRLEQSDPAPAQDLLAWYVQGSYFITDETRPYRRDVAVFGAPRQPHGRAGAWELTARYDGATNRDAESLGGACGGGPATDTCNVQALTVGLNWYWFHNIRLMLNYTIGEQDRGADGEDRPKNLAARLQASF